MGLMYNKQQGTAHQHALPPVLMLFGKGHYRFKDLGKDIQHSVKRSRLLTAINEIKDLPIIKAASPF